MSFTEKVAALRALFERSVMEEADSLFDLFDSDGSGQLDYVEISAMFPTPPAAQRQRSRRRADVLVDPAYSFMHYVDEDQSGTLDREEWRAFIMKGWRHQPQAARAFCMMLRNQAAMHGLGKK